MSPAEFQFVQLNSRWNADPNVPLPRVELDASDVLLSFGLNAFRFPDFAEGELGILRFANCSKYRLGEPNDEGWYLGQCRYSKLAPAWGEFYEIQGETPDAASPQDWKFMSPQGQDQPKKHFLLYFRDETFECFADQYRIESHPDNALMRLGVYSLEIAPPSYSGERRAKQ